MNFCVVSLEVYSEYHYFFESPKGHPLWQLGEECSCRGEANICRMLRSLQRKTFRLRKGSVCMAATARMTIHPVEACTV